MSPVAISLALVLAIFPVGCKLNQQPDNQVPPQNLLVGAWLITETPVKTPESTWTNENPQPGVYLFTERHFSNMLVPNEARQLFDSKTTDAEKLTAYTNFIADCGAYEVNGSVIVTHNIVAKWPNAMHPDREPGSGITYQFSFDGDSLLLTLDSAWAPPNGEIRYRLKRLE
jgi:hypothetical protein